MSDKLKMTIEEDANFCDFYVGNEHSDKSHGEQAELWVGKFHEITIERVLSKLEVMMALADERGDSKRWAIIEQVHEELCKEYGVEK